MGDTGSQRGKTHMWRKSPQARFSAIEYIKITSASANPRNPTHPNAVVGSASGSLIITIGIPSSTKICATGTIIMLSRLNSKYAPNAP